MVEKENSKIQQQKGSYCRLLTLNLTLNIIATLIQIPTQTFTHLFSSGTLYHFFAMANRTFATAAVTNAASNIPRSGRARKKSGSDKKWLQLTPLRRPVLFFPHPYSLVRIFQLFSFHRPAHAYNRQVEERF